jgi:hypothetical protein
MNMSWHVIACPGVFTGQHVACHLLSTFVVRVFVSHVGA